MPDADSIEKASRQINCPKRSLKFIEFPKTRIRKKMKNASRRPTEEVDWPAMEAKPPQGLSRLVLDARVKH